MREEWRPVVGNDLYAVSDSGRVRRDKPGKGAVAGQVRKQFPDDNGYLEVRLPTIGTVGVHRLVAAAFIGLCPAGKEVDHKDKDRTNNRWKNLRYVKHKKNCQLSWEDGGHENHPARERHGMAKLLENDVFEIRGQFGKVSGVELGRK